MKKRVQIRRLAIALLCAALTLLPFAGYYASWAGNALGDKETERVTIVAETAHPLSTGQRLQLQVRYGGVPVDAQTFLAQAVEKEGWYVSQDGMLCTDALHRPLSFDMEFPNVYEFCFLSYGDSPCVSIRCGHGNVTEELYSGTVFHTQYRMVEGNELHASPYGVKHHVWLAVIILAGMLLFAVLHGWLRISLPALVCGTTLAGLAATALLLKQLSVGYALLLALGAAAALMLSKCAELRKCLRGFSCGLPLAGLAALCAYASFALFGNRLFLQMPVVTVTLRTVSLFWLLTVAAAPLVCLLVVVLALAPRCAAKLAQNAVRTRVQIRRTRLLCLLCALLPLGIAIIGFYPCASSYDGTLYWNRGVGIEPMGEPFGYCLLLRGLACITTNPVIYAVFQSLLFALAVSGIARILYSRGVPRWVVCLLSFGAAALPVNMMYCMLLSTNPLMAILLLYALYFLVRLLDEPDACARSWAWLGGAFICCVAIAQVRRNGLPVMVLFLFVLCVVAWKHRGAVARRVLILTMCIVAATAVVNWQGNQVLTGTGAVANNSGTMARFLFKPVAAAYANDCALPEETLEVMERVYGCQWVDMAYDPHDSDVFVNNEHYHLELEPTGTYIRLFLDTFMRYPAAVVKDLLDQSELAWSVFACPLNRNIRYHIGVDQQLPTDSWLPVHPWPQAGAAISDVVVGAADAIADQAILDSLCYRAGLYVILFLALALVLLKQRRGRYLLSMLPVLGLALTTFPAASFPFYQYFWFFPLNVSFFAMLCVFDGKDLPKE